jgi:uncharacterized damage-inducible protein DinB
MESDSMDAWTANQECITILDCNIPPADEPVFSHLLHTYASETNKTIMMWMRFQPTQMDFRPDSKSSSVEEIMQHHLLSERRFFGEFLGTAEPAADLVLPAERSPKAYTDRLRELAFPRLAFFAICSSKWWLEAVPFFDVSRERIWIFWRRLLHSAHHRAQLTVYLRLLGTPVPAIYGPSADETWAAADPTNSVDAAQRKKVQPGLSH